MSQVRSFEIAVPGAVLDDLRVRLDRTRPARGAAAAGWLTGTDPSYLASFVTSWAGEYQWRDTESALNGLPQLLVSVAGADIHVFRIGARTPAAGAAPVPLVLTHGWPSSFFEFLPPSRLNTGYRTALVRGHRAPLRPGRASPVSAATI